MMTTKHRLEEVERRAAQGRQKPFTIRELFPGESFEEKFGHAQQPHEFVIQWMNPPVWPDDPDFDGTQPAPE